MKGNKDLEDLKLSKKKKYLKCSMTVTLRLYFCKNVVIYCISSLFAYNFYFY